MHIWRQTLDDLDLKLAWHEPWFFWTLTRMWHEAKEAKELSGQFWMDLCSALDDFDEAHPEGHCPAGLALAQ